MKLFKKVKDNKIKVVLNGQGIDEIFGGYDLLYKNIKNGEIYHPSGKALTNHNRNYLKSKIKNLILETI